MAEIRMATEKQVALINKFASTESFALTMMNRRRTWWPLGKICSDLEGLPIEKLTCSAASHIISLCINYKDSFEYMSVDDCQEIDDCLKAYAAQLLDSTRTYVPKGKVTQCAIPQEKWLRNPDGSINPYGVRSYFEVSFDYDGHIELYRRNNPIEEDTFEQPTLEEVAASQEEHEGGEDWYREGSGQYYEDRMEMACGYDC